MLRTVAFIPVRGGSKRIPGKNVKEFCGKPLLYHVLDAACRAGQIDSVVVSTDSPVINANVNYASGHYINLGANKIHTYKRSDKTATDEATTESAMLEYFEQVKCETVVLLQVTSPLTTACDINFALQHFRDKELDSLLSVAKQKRFHWSKYNCYLASPENYNIFKRQRGQDFRDCQYVENGAIYITKYQKLIETKNRLSGRIGLYEMPDYTYLEIDTMEDFKALEAIMRYRQNGE